MSSAQGGGTGGSGPGGIRLKLGGFSGRNSRKGKLNWRINLKKKMYYIKGAKKKYMETES